jgi:hypothetical protein
MGVRLQQPSPSGGIHDRRQTEASVKCQHNLRMRFLPAFTAWSNLPLLDWELTGNPHSNARRTGAQTKTRGAQLDLRPWLGRSMLFAGYTASMGGQPGDAQTRVVSVLSGRVVKQLAPGGSRKGRDGGGRGSATAAQSRASFVHKSSIALPVVAESWTLHPPPHPPRSPHVLLRSVSVEAVSSPSLGVGPKIDSGRPCSLFPLLLTNTLHLQSTREAGPFLL